MVAHQELSPRPPDHNLFVHIRISLCVTGKNIVLRAALAFSLAVLGLMLFAVSGAYATPIDPDLRQMLKQAEQPPPVYAPARAGWNGPLAGAKTPAEAKGETADSSTTSADFNLLLDQAALTEAMRRELAAIVIPDPRVLAGIAALILLLRKWRSLRLPLPQPAA